MHLVQLIFVYGVCVLCYENQWLVSNEKAWKVTGHYKTTFIEFPLKVETNADSIVATPRFLVKRQ